MWPTRYGASRRPISRRRGASTGGRGIPGSRTKTSPRRLPGSRSYVSRRLGLAALSRDSDLTSPRYRGRPNGSGVSGLTPRKARQCAGSPWDPSRHSRCESEAMELMDRAGTFKAQPGNTHVLAFLSGLFKKAARAVRGFVGRLRRAIRRPPEPVGRDSHGGLLSPWGALIRSSCKSSRFGTRLSLCTPRVREATSKRSQRLRRLTGRGGRPVSSRAGPTHLAITGSGAGTERRRPHRRGSGARRRRAGRRVWKRGRHPG